MSLSFSSSLFALFFYFFLLFSTVCAFNVTKILNEYSDFGNFNDLLSRTRLAEAINSRRTITVLAVDNGNIAQINSFSTDIQKHLLSLHVILDYYDISKLQKLKKNTAILTTLYQSSGQARGQDGFLNVTNVSGSILFGSAVKGSGLNANLVQSVTSQPYNISVLQVSTIIMPEGFDTSGNQTPPPAKAPSPSKAKSPAEAPEPAEADTPSSESPTPEADSSFSSPPAADGPAADGPAADSHKGGASTISGSTRTSFAMVAIFLCLAWILRL